MSEELLDQLNIDRGQYEVLLKFREAVQDLLKPGEDEFHLVRWLRARNFDIRKAESMLRKSLEWRKTYDVDGLLNSYKSPEVLRKFDIGGRCGLDKEMSPVWIYMNARLDTKGLYYSAHKRDIIKHYIRKMEFHVHECIQLSQQHGKRIDKAVMICDLEGFTVQHLFAKGMDVILLIFQMIESNYPEKLKKCYIVNGGSIFSLVFRIIKPFLNEETRRRIVMLGSDYKQKLLEEIDAEQIPVRWGGTRVDPETGDEWCSTLVNLGGVIPEEYYLKGEDLVSGEDVITVKVGASQSSEVEHVVEKSNVIVRYTFWTRDYDIKFGVRRKATPGGEPEKQVVPLKKYAAQSVPVDNTFNCDTPATYVFTFDNSYSWFNAKDLCYSIRTIDPNDIAPQPEDANFNLNE